MIKPVRLFSFLLFTLVLVMVLTNPSKEAFMDQVAEDYGTMHHGLTLSTQQLDEMGESYSQSYLIMGVHTYQFGSIAVSYLGVFWVFC